jgi:beta-galactosidase
MTKPKLILKHIAYGGDYNPEQWPEETWLGDVRLMREAGVNMVSLGIFSWAKLEPQPGCYDFGWLDRIVALLHENGISIDLATSTASPPPWFARLHPESLPVTEAGIRLEIGARQHYSPSSQAYRAAAIRSRWSPTGSAFCEDHAVAFHDRLKNSAFLGRMVGGMEG